MRITFVPRPPVQEGKAEEHILLPLKAELLDVVPINRVQAPPRLLRFWEELLNIRQSHPIPQTLKTGNQPLSGSVKLTVSVDLVMQALILSRLSERHRGSEGKNEEFECGLHILTQRLRTAVRWRTTE